MKKIVAMTALAAAAAGTLSAEITFGMWGRALWNTAANANHDEVVTDVHQSWGGDAPRGGLSVQGKSDNVGVHVDFHANATSLGLGDNNNIWVKPIDQVKVTVGKMDENELRGDACFGLWDWDRIGTVSKAGVQDSEGWIFPDIFDVNGVNINVYPVDGLTVGAAVNVPLANSDTSPTVEHAWGHQAKYGLGYTVDGLGTFKLGAVMQGDKLRKVKNSGDLKSKKNWAKIHAAAELNPTEQLTVKVGAAIPTVSSGAYRSVSVTKRNTHGYDASEATSNTYVCPEVNTYFSFKASDALTIHVINGNKIDCADTYDKKGDKKLSKKEKGHYGWLLGAGVDFNLENGISFFGDVRYANDIYLHQNSDDFGCLTTGFGVNKGFSNGSIGVALETASNNQGRYTIKHHGSDYNVNKDAIAWSIPVRVQYWF